MAAIPIIAGIASLVGTGLSVAGSLKQGEASAAAATYNAERAKEQGDYTRWQTARDLQNQQINAAKTMGSIRAAYGASGVSVSSGSAQEEAEGAAALLRQQTHDIVSKGQYQEQQYSNEMNAYRSGAISDQTGGQIAAVGAGISGVGRTLASTWSGGGGGGGGGTPPGPMGSSGGTGFAV